MPQQRRKISAGRRECIALASDRRCYICGATNGPFDIEHPIPLALGGSDRDEDLRLVCALSGPNPCHRDKTAADLGRIAKAKRLERKHRGERPVRFRKLAPSRFYRPQSKRPQ
jgi:hypothetical protein